MITADTPNHRRFVDTILWSDSISGAFIQTSGYITLVGTHGIVLHPDKFHFAQDTAELRWFPHHLGIGKAATLPRGRSQTVPHAATHNKHPRILRTGEPSTDTPQPID